MVIRDFYEINERSSGDSGSVVNLSINGAHELFEGHFPGKPVTPGVVLMQLFKEEAERFTESSLLLVRATNVKFISILDPKEDDQLILESHFSVSEDHVELKGIAKTSDKNVLKINCLYKFQ